MSETKDRIRAERAQRLVDEMARRLYEVAETSPFAHGNEWKYASMAERSAFERVAEECLRQMEFARRCVSVSGPTTIESTDLRFGEIVPVTKIIAPGGIRLGDLTLAPPEWLP